jgi:putative FmdB family regulatory protein
MAHGEGLARRGRLSLPSSEAQKKESRPVPTKRGLNTTRPLLALSFAACQERPGRPKSPPYTCEHVPIYEYRCRQGHVFEVMQSMTDDPVTACTECRAPVERVFHPVAVHFKGSGFYSTDYGRKRSGDSGSSGNGKSDSKETSPATSGESSTASSGSSDD